MYVFQVIKYYKIDIESISKHLTEHFRCVNFDCGVAFLFEGSHNSGTSELDPSLGVAVDQSSGVRALGGSCCGSAVVRKWARTQHLSIAEQLDAGIRYLDFRVAQHPGTRELHVVHGLYGGLVEQALRDVQVFLLRNPHEVVILDFNHFYNMGLSAHKHLLSMIRAVFENTLVPRPFSTPTYKMWGTTLNAIWQTQYRVIAVYNHDSADEHADVWHGEYVDSPWPNTHNADKLIAFHDTSYSNRTRLRNDSFYNWQGILTPRTKDVVLHLGSSLEERHAYEATLRFVKWLRDGKAPGPQGINVCTADFVELHNFIGTVIGLNMQTRDVPEPFLTANP